MSGSRTDSASKRRERKRRLPAVTLAAVVLVALSFALAGCSVEMGLTTTVKDDGSGSTGVRLAIDEELQNTLLQAASGLSGLGDLGSLFEGLEDLGGLEMLEGLTPESLDVLLTLLIGSIPTDWSVDQGTDDEGTRWISLSHDFADLDELQGLSTGQVMSTFFGPDGFSLTQDKGFFKTRTTYSAVVDPGGAMEEAGESGLDIPLEMLGEVFKLENRVTLPGTIKDNDADQVQGNTLVWKMGISGSTRMRAESVTYDWVHIGLIAFAGLVGLIILTLLVIWLIRHRRRRAEAQQAPSPPLPPPPAQALSEVPPPPTSVPVAPPVPQSPPSAAAGPQEFMLGRVTDDEKPPEAT